MNSMRDGLAYKDYRVSFWFYGQEGNSTKMAEIHIWRKRRIMGWIEHNRVMKILKLAAYRRYKDGGQVRGVQFHHTRGLTPVIGERIEWHRETKIFCETNNEVDWKHGEYGCWDIIIFQFNREYDK